MIEYLIYKLCGGGTMHVKLLEIVKMIGYLIYKLCGGGSILHVKLEAMKIGFDHIW